MLKTFSAKIDPNGRVTLDEKIVLDRPTRALVTILDDSFEDDVVTSLSEAALADSWDTPEEDEAWKDLNRLPEIREDGK